MEASLAAAVEEAARGALGTAFRVTSAEPASGGTHRNWIVGSAAQRVFVKTSAATNLALFDAEVDALSAIAATGTIRTPAIVASGASEAHAFLILEHLPLRPMQAADAPRCAAALAQLHSTVGEHYGWRRNNFIGQSPQDNSPRADWPAFFAHQRLAPQFAEAARRGYRGDLQNHGERIIDKIGAFFLERRPEPALLHGDLWAGNIAVTAEGEPVVFDPATYFGDREADFAMSELFGGLPERFYLSYMQAAPLAEGYPQRRTLYNLYHMLNHLNLFGASYLRQAERMARELSEYLRR
ncbi:fructosamine kinase family protein [Niveibacterium sp. COAC-50]|uniref:fructosamine kinase family protein n=1 Tax=Niveibacterium sp. COAC-50 TaxID=2729384 RepID=UPI0015517E55|nr:fructosamine kinase family protein [Niveibacterium sp. COAC-50]